MTWLNPYPVLCHIDEKRANYIEKQALSSKWEDIIHTTRDIEVMNQIIGCKDIDMNQELKWHQRPVRMMRIDYYADQIGKLKTADLDKLARSVRDEWHSNCEWILATPGMAPGLGYQTTFNTEQFEKFTPLGDFDLIRAYAPHAKKYGIHLIAYMDMHWFAYSFADQHKDWEQITANGESYGTQFPLYGNGTTFCVNSGWRDWAFEIIAEAMKTGIDGCFLDGPVIFPGCCYCESCRKKFKSIYGTDMPVTEDWSDPNWINFVQFRSRSLAEFLKGCREAVQSVNPEGVVFLNAGSWAAGTWRFARSMEIVGEFEDFNGAEAFFHPGPHEHLLYPWAPTGKYMAAGDKPAIVFSHAMMGVWHYLPLSKIETELAIAQTVATGANPWFATTDYAIQYSHDEAIEPIKEIQGFIAEHEEYYENTSSCAEIALLNSSQAGTYYFSSFEGFYGETGSGKEENLLVDMGSGAKEVDWKKRKEICEASVDNSYLGYFLAMTRSHIPFDVVIDKNISSEGLSKYKVLILPNSACLSDSQIVAIKEFVKRGGGVIAEFETGYYDELGHRRDANPLHSLLGIDQIKGIYKPRTGEEYIRIKKTHLALGDIAENNLMVRPPYSLKCTADANAFVPSVFMNEVGGSYVPLQGESPYAAMIVKDHGAGRTVYLPSLAGDLYGRFKLPEYQKLIESIIKWVHNEPLLLETDCLSTVEIEPRINADKDQILLHVVNNTGDMQRPIMEVVPMSDIRIRLRCSGAKNVRALWAGQELESRYSDGQLEFILPKLDIYELIVVEL